MAFVQEALESPTSTWYVQGFEDFCGTCLSLGAIFWIGACCYKEDGSGAHAHATTPVVSFSSPTVTKFCFSAQLQSLRAWA